MRLKGKTAIITGGGGGIGRAVVRKFLEEGAQVAVVGNAAKELSGFLRELRPVYDEKRVLGIRTDVSRLPDVRRAVAAAARRFKKIDVLVNAAGIQKPIGPFTENQPQDWLRNIEVNLFGTVLMCKAVLPHMRKAKSGSIINFSGGGATFARQNFSAYAVAKAGVVKFSEVLAAELQPSGIRVNSIAPGAVNTGMLKEVLKVGAAAGEKELADAKKREKEGGTPAEIPAELVVFLASDASRGLSGRLISAVWDDWRHWDKNRIEKIMQSDALTLRRLKEDGSV